MNCSAQEKPKVPFKAEECHAGATNAVSASSPPLGRHVVMVIPGSLRPQPNEGARLGNEGPALASGKVRKSLVGRVGLRSVVYTR